MNATESISTPIGTLIIEANAKGIRRIIFMDKPIKQSGEGSKKARSIAMNAAHQLTEYFTSKRTSFDLPLDLSGLPPYHLVTLKEVNNIPYGKTASYGEIAKQTGSPNAARAVGNANAHNPIPVVIPCHRVIAGNGGLGGYGGRLDRKEFLLRLEDAF
ncbi:MAG: methylated-DNA--[protein]-cysteine S-methyltransferase [Candidatus Marinimicrobia bacterium]|jgi:methylated-DNA-[protein]-cysteine S-methyltransferase|nr:methylated-DNA--[protein]-cysteine S-methyltransferase [Candidatus Neomarinimicrobiota bacterium]MBT3617921.1 methylated-DNA--[protein]-cysteine S-methyltransferase [Candidatus Neomarinimicrobiota bacterium]MBT3828758.1 methylated-DNA--[protein]-cysteine S-methyltransferase [Candidatus Neomarinimicrobiota bacterium]MBT3997049.1 methylated-DNA--[protein]-cysteine S-methyltransferase [Candidatus Neomarinimicrobiota bacterium]MBT4280805.1 methylated-DNA--[protein]-cysteine S-methyltransferase [